MKVYNKLVRDKIPEIIKSDNKECEIKIMDDESYFNALNNKLSEELNEYLLNYDIEELADLNEVILSILKFKGISNEEFNKIREEKVNKRGSFDKKILLVSVKEKNSKN